LLDSPRQRLTDEIADLCAGEAVMRGGAEEMIAELLHPALEIIHDIWGLFYEVSVADFLAGRHLSHWFEHELIAFTMPPRRDPAIALRDGVLSDHHFDLSDAWLPGTTHAYLNHPAMAHPTLDFMLIDLHVTDYACRLGDEVGKSRRWKAVYALWQQIGNKDLDAVEAAIVEAEARGAKIPTAVSEIVARRRVMQQTPSRRAA